MSTKAEIQSNIDTQMASGQDMPISDHRGVLKDDTHNLLDTMYPDVQTDTQSSETLITLSSAGSCKYTITYCKQGRIVFMSGVIYDVTTDINTLGSINLSDYDSATANTQYCVMRNNYSSAVTSENVMTITNSGLATLIQFTDTVSAGDVYYFSAQYLTED